MPPGINSPIGGRTFTATSGQRVVEVPDESEHWDEEPMQRGMGALHPDQYPGEGRPNPLPVNEIEAGIRAARAAKQSGRAVISPGARQRVEYLANIGRVRKDVKVDETTFSLRTLKNFETRDSIVATAMVDKVEQLFEARKQQLARSLFAVDGNELAVILGGDTLDIRLAFIDELDENLVSHLYSAFAELSNEASKRFGVKSEADMKEVSEDIKK